MTKNENTEKSKMAGKVKLFNSMTKQTIIIAEDDLVNYDVRLWRVV